MRSGAKGTPPPDVNAAYALYQQGNSDEARKIINEVLKTSPNHLQARALRDRMDTEELKQFQTKTQDVQVLGDVNPIALWGILGLGIALAIAGTWLAIAPLRAAFAAGGLSKQIVSEQGGVVAGRVQAPAHFMLIYPVIFYLIAAACFYTFRRYRDE